ncbi:hypothetical protein [Streptomyces varsoviensis]|uniref:Integral membrane protein n=1 Tax=Streptomyces varsoviensis TaxID=67373 RepID=A0ABR5J519_9ACTN|nr:hypothetical protein [Streptomyces varsoviensis]KOG88562.1 hypothetical protein ADK38_19115 [Streptomyces varsoviensis]
MYGYGTGTIYWEDVPFVGWPLLGALLCLTAAVLLTLLAWYLDRRDRAARAHRRPIGRPARRERDEGE